MTFLRTLIAATALILAPMAGGAIANEKAAVQKFYDFLSNPASKAHAAEFMTVAANNWESIGDYSSKKKSREKFVGQLAHFGKLIPNLNWTVKEMIQSGNRVIVRSRATGTPKGPFFGVDGKGKSFDIMAIDIHTLKDGKIVRSYHVEDWAGALRQLKGK
ncbi:MAG: polyketide cyclase [Rhodospirillaceae bacterium]|nr:polyketide cyclase [Rhodospirillaceae bacterium]|tara:strand:+ start:1532 stop:2011 length:480 start_codon:yes stop_codon:yes gene_type:complete